MHSSSPRTPSRLAPILPGTLRASAKLIASSSSTALTPFTGHRRPPPPARALPSLPEEPLTRPASWSDEFEQISYDEFRRTLLLADPSYAFSTTEDTSSAFYDEDPFRKVESPSESEFPELRSSLQAVIECSEPSYPSYHSQRDARSSSSTTLVSDQTSIRSIRPLKRLKSLSKLSLFGSRKSTTSEQEPALPEPLPSRPVVAEVVTDYIPELSFEHFDCEPIFEEDEEESPAPPAVPPKEPQSPLQTVQQLDPALSKYISHLQVYRYERVDPRDLTASSRTSTIIGYSPAASPLPPPSPSWLSRNVKDLEFYSDRETSLQAPRSPDPIPIPPPSPRPLPILPRSFLPIRSRTSLAESQSCADHPDVPESPRSTSSSVTLFVASNAASPVRSSFYPRSRPPSAVTNRLSVIYNRQSLTDTGNSRFLLTYSSLGPGTAHSQRSSLIVLFPNPSPGPQTHLSLPDSEPLYSDHASASLPESSDARLSRTLHPAAPASKPPKPSLRILIPNQPASQEPAPDQIPFPAYLLAAIRDPSIMSAMAATYDKPNDTVDWGEDYDYNGYEWFKDPPPRPEPAPPQPMPAMPDQAAMHQNAMFDFALKSAPNVLYARYKQYGQLGVLAWSSEFSEMIDALKVLGFEGNMFVATRTQALRTCEEIVKLLKTNIKVDMQIIILYLCNQVVRLRRFLDGDHQWNDYPETTFPIDPYKHGAE
ncbi:hypothetical protein EVJ58_g3441 [Rhodofomes roseus]|uniref:Uncharacterized protein n=1 Tax=Rhodofomes roseus TaxID=34475 RepID=A0A4Y9YMF7_9APHY|nr:hypothetical protein EVJ58_g3441 [Rhodofomes roseus]